MSGWPILDVAIGLCFVFLLLSTICTTLTEGITTQLRSRSKYLEQGIGTLLGHAPGASDAFYSHPIVRSFTHQEGDSVPREIFRGIKARVSGQPTSVRSDQRPSYLPGDKFAVVALEMAGKKDKDGALLYPDLAKTVTELLKGATTDEARIKALQVWYDQVMERVSGWYKRHAQAWVRALSIVIVLTLNADTMHIANLFWSDPTLRQVAVEQAKVRLRQPPPENTTIEYSDSDETLPDSPPDQVGTPGDSSDRHLGLTGDQWQLLQQLMGWDEDKGKLEQDLENWRAASAQESLARASAEQEGKPASQPAAIGSEFHVYLSWIGYLLSRHLLGWFITVVAISFGAPFWYGALNRLVNIRNAGANPAKKSDGITDKDGEKKQ